ncbi:hypothetical protein F4860DRAFT_240888 [Xylaria cubensis]|nr:hypothetical protein F4860DRAFT_240888 [Xylaria cubensis]
MEAKIGCFPGCNRDSREFLRAVEESVDGKDKECLTIIHSDVPASSFAMKKSINYSMAAAHREVTQKRLESAKRSRNDAEASYNIAYHKSLEAEVIRKKAQAAYEKHVGGVSIGYKAAIEAADAGLRSAQAATEAAKRTGVNALRSIHNVQIILSNITGMEDACEKLSAAKSKANEATNFRPSLHAYPIDVISSFATVDCKVRKAVEAVKIAEEAEWTAKEAFNLARIVANIAKAALETTKKSDFKDAKAQKEKIDREVEEFVIEGEVDEAKRAKEEAATSSTTAQNGGEAARKAQRQMNEAAEAMKNADTETIGFNNSKRQLEQSEKELKEAGENYNTAVEAVDMAALALERRDGIGTESDRNTSDSIRVTCVSRNSLAKNNDRARRDVFLAHLKDDAIIWYDSLPGHIKEDWLSLKSEFLRHFRRN